MSGPANATARPDPRGGAVALAWTNPMLPGFKGTQVLRQERDYPVVPDDVRNSNNVVFDDTTTPAGGRGRFLDVGLKCETTYYYAIVPYDAEFRPSAAFVSAMTTTPYQSAAHLYRSLPEIYRAHDTHLPPPSSVPDPNDARKGQLLRFIEMFGPTFDLLRSYASGTRSFRDVDNIDGALLPLLAQWVGWETNFATPLPVQRNEVKFAPRWYATTGTAQNLLASINRLVSWNVQIKEFAHNIVLSNRPEELTIREQQRLNGQWQPAASISLDVAYEGRPSVLLLRDGRIALFYHARQSAAGQALDRWHLACKICDRDGWLPAVPLTRGETIDRCPAAVQRSDGSMLLFWSGIDPQPGGRPMPQLRMRALSIGRQALNARTQSANAAPFAFADGDTFRIAIGTLARTITLRREQFANIAQATAAETAAVLDRQLPDVDVIATADNRIAFGAHVAGAASMLAFPPSPAGTKLGMPAGAAGADALTARLAGTRAEPFALADGDTLVIAIDGDIPRTVTFKAVQTGAAEVAAAINAVLPGAAAPQGGRIQLTSPHASASSVASVDVSLSSAAHKLGFGAPPPVANPAVDDTEPTTFVDGAGNVWLFWSSRRNGRWNILYSRFDGTTWGATKTLTTQTLPDREPFVMFDPANAGRIWVFFSRKKANGLWNVFFRTTTKLDFNTLVNADWTEAEMTTAAGSFDNREAAAVIAAPGSVELYVASNRGDGWKIWGKTVTPTSQGAELAMTTGQFTHRSPVPLAVNAGALRLFFRGNDSIAYPSNVYPGLATVDTRYAGSTTADTRNATRIGLRRRFQDIGHYTYHVQATAPAEETSRLYARDTVGVYFTPDTNDPRIIAHHRDLLTDAITRFLPLQVRATLLAD